MYKTVSELMLLCVVRLAILRGNWNGSNNFLVDYYVYYVGIAVWVFWGPLCHFSEDYEIGIGKNLVEVNLVYSGFNLV